MRLLVLAVGRLKAGPERDLQARYRERMHALGRGVGLPGGDIVEIPESRARRDEDRVREEGRALLQALPDGAVVLACDERGRNDLSSDVLAGRVRAWRDEARPALAVVVGGADGLDAAVRARADLILAFGAATLPHGLVRVLVLEQLYRAMTIIAGHPYHRGEPGPGDDGAPGGPAPGRLRA